MEFTQYTCPVCNEKFQSGDDVVVCPECGAPHHRSCYEKENRCFFQDRHKEQFSYESLFEQKQEQNNQQTQGFEDFETIICPVCFLKNPKGSRTCARCGTDLRMENPESNPNNQQWQQYQPPFGGQNQQQNNNQQNGQPNRMPFGFGTSGIPNFDPLAGLDSKEEVGENVNAGEAAKFTGKNTPYFSLVFQRLRKQNRSKFSFAALIFSGIYFLYRKMYGIGLLFTMLVIVTNVLSTFVMMTPEWSSCARELVSLSPNDVMNANGTALVLGKMLYFYLPFLLNGVRYVIMLVSGLTANRLYYKHSIKKINQIKHQNKELSADELHQTLEAGGGVNLPLALSFGITTLVISYICNFFLMGIM